MTTPMTADAPKPDDVTALVERLRTTPLYHSYGEESDLPNETADALERLAADNARLTRESREQRDALAAARDENERLREVLRFYGDRSSYRSRIGMDSPITRDDFGARARAMLEQGGGDER